MTETTHVALKTLPVNAFIEGTYNLVNPQVGVTRKNEAYLKCLLRDATGEVAARKWRFEEAELAIVSATGFVRIAGRTELYNGQPQMIIEEIRAVEPDARDLAALLPHTTRDIGRMFDRVREILGTIEHPAMKALADEYLGDQELMARFKSAPAAVTLHHAWIGGLLEHTLDLLELADAMLRTHVYRDAAGHLQLNRDLVLLGAFLHDLSKTTELEWERGFNYTTSGNLIGHLVHGAIELQFMAWQAGKKSGHRLPPDALIVLQHIVISHHALPEHGAAKVPATPEAIFVALLDNLAAKSAMAIAAAGRGDAAVGDAPFTDRIWALDTKLFRPDPLRASGGA